MHTDSRRVNATDNQKYYLPMSRHKFASMHCLHSATGDDGSLPQIGSIIHLRGASKSPSAFEPGTEQFMKMWVRKSESSQGHIKEFL